MAGENAREDDTFGRAIGEARERWPLLQVEPADFGAFLESLRGGDTQPDAELDLVCVSDLYLAFACGQGEPRAIRAFEEEFLPSIGAAVRRIRPDPAFVSEIQQLVRQRLLVREEGRAPRITRYAGAGPLGAWTRAVAVNLALNQIRTEERADVRSRRATEEATRIVGTDPMLALLRARHAEDFRAAFEEAVTALPRRERIMLRFHALDGLTGREIAAIFGLNRTTVSELLSRARRSLRDETRKRIKRRLDLSDSEATSLVHTLLSGTELSLRRLMSDRDA